ncbi:MAG: hypothetical protein L6W00_09295 [Lentisphaeria bacterium]|nr:MAG: hypothetical protein L6W00_09295 [Lentisphaeria bacterium]
MPSVILRDGSDPGDLLRLLICEQYPWHLIAPEEAAGDEDREVITPSASGIRLERAGLMLDSLPALAELLHKRYPQSVTVVTPEGKKADSLLVREFADGSIAILDLTEQETGRRLLLRRNGGEIPFTLAGRERRFFPSAPPLSEVRVNRDRLNLVRPEWNEAGEFRFRVSAGISFRLYFRTGVAVRFDGSPVDAETPSPELGPGFGGLYRRSPEFSVAPGPHRLQLTGEPDRFCFLPALWIGGDFAFDAPALLGPERFDGSGLDHYAGTRIQTGFGEIPAAATGVELGNRRHGNGNSARRRIARNTVMAALCLGDSGATPGMPPGMADSPLRLHSSDLRRTGVERAFSQMLRASEYYNATPRSPTSFYRSLINYATYCDGMHTLPIPRSAGNLLLHPVSRPRIRRTTAGKL